MNKKLFRMLIAVLFISISTSIYAQLSRQQAIDKVLNEIVVADTGYIDVWSTLEIKNYQDTIGLIMDTVLACPYNYNWVFFVDDHPSAGWAHPCRYIFLDSLNGDYQIVDENRYPLCFGYNGSNDYDLVMQVAVTEPAVLPPNQNPSASVGAVNEHLYAVIIISQDAEKWDKGMSPEHPNRFWFDASLVYNTLIEHGYADENIFIHYYNGTSPRNMNDLNEPDGDNHIDYDASKSRILQTFDNLAGTSTSDPDVPALGPDDQLFVYIDGHGSASNGKSRLWLRYGDDDYLYDDDIAESVEPMNCAQMIFLVQPCNSGNFASVLTDYNPNLYNVACQNRVVHTSTTIDLLSTSEHYITGDTYTEFTYYWVAAVRGVYPVIEEPWTPSIYTTGTFPFDDFDFPVTHPDDYSPDDPNETGNGDGFIQLEEAFLYADDMDIWSPNGYYYDSPNWEAYEEPVREDKIGYPDEYGGYTNNLITIQGLAGSVVDDNILVSDRNYMVGDAIIVEDGNYLDIEENSNVYFVGDDSKIEVNAGGELNIYDNVQVYGGSSNSIQVDGNIVIGENVTFSYYSPSATFGGLLLNNHDMQTTFPFTSFIKTGFRNYGSGLIMNDCNFDNCSFAYSYRGNVTINNSVFNETWLYLENQAHDPYLTANVSGSTFNNTNTHVGIDILGYGKYFISNNSIKASHNGIQLSNSGEGSSLFQVISGNTINYCGMSGISAYNSSGTYVLNTINNNQFGLKIMNNCNIAISGNPSAQTYNETNYIRDNDSYEIYASTYSFPWYFRYNVIIDEDNLGNPTDPMVYYQPSGGGSLLIDVRYNCWGNNFSQTADLYPTGYMVDPTWCPPGGGHKSTEIALEDYLAGLDYFENEQYTDAKTSFESIVNLYPKTQYAGAAMKELFSLEKFSANDYGTLQQYYETNDSIQADTVLSKLAVFLSNKCEIELQNWQTAIDHFEDIIENPVTPEDSIFAIIDLGYTYLLMDDSGYKSTAQGRLLEHKPASQEAFSTKRDYLLSLLPFEKSGQQIELPISANKQGELIQNVPNPFSNTTSIQFNLNSIELSSVEIRIYNQLGKEITQIPVNSVHEGLNAIEFNAQGFPVGIYFYSLLINEIRIDTKKLIIQ